MAIPLATAFVRVRADTSYLKKDVESGVKGAGASAVKAGDQSGKGWASAFGKRAVGAADLVTKAMAGAAVGVGVEAVKMATDFQESMTQLVTGAGVAKKDLGAIEEGVKRIAVETGTTTDQLAKGEYLIASAGFTGASGLKVLKAAAEGAKTGNADLGDVANAVTTILKDYALKSKDATAVTSQLVETVARGKVHLGDLSNALARILPQASALHIPFSQVAAAIANMTARGTTARLAAQSLNSAILAISAPASGAAKEMAVLNLSTQDFAKYQKAVADGNTKAADALLKNNNASQQLAQTLTHHGLIEAFQLMSHWAQEAGPIGSAEYIKAMKTMAGGSAGLRAALQLTGNAGKDLASNEKAIGDAAKEGGSEVKGFGEVQADAAFKLAKLKSEAQVLAINLGQKLLPAFTAVTGWAGDHTGLIITFAAAFGGVALAVSAANRAMIIFRATNVLLSKTVIGTAIQLKALAAAEKLAAFGGAGAVAALGAALLVLGVAVDKIVTAKSAVQNIVDTLAKSTGAVGTNVDGYNRLSDALSKAAGNYKILTDQVGSAGIKYGVVQHLQNQLNDASVQAAQTATNLSGTLDILAAKYGLTTDQAQQLIAASHSVNLLLASQGKLTPKVIEQIDHYALSTKSGQDAVKSFNDDLSTYNNTTLTATERTNALSGALQKFFNPAVSADQATIQMKNDQAELARALAQSGGKTGLLTQAQRDARSAFQTYIQDTANAAQKAFDATGKTADYRSVIKNALPTLLQAAGDNKALREEVQKLIDTMAKMHTEKVNIFVHGSGSYVITPPGGGPPLLNPPGTKPVARGGFLTGGMPGKDSIPLLGMPGEVVVPTNMVKAGAVDHLRGMLPGFAKGGVVGKYDGDVKGLAPFVATENSRTLKTMERAVATATQKAMFQGFGTALGIKVAQTAMSYVGKVPYLWGGTTTSGWDCSGMVMNILNRYGFTPPRTAAQQQAWSRRAPAEVGAMAFFSGADGGNGVAGHVGFYVGGGKYVSAYGTGFGTIVMPVNGSSGSFYGFGVPPSKFDKGGWLMPGQVGINMTNKPERVISPSEASSAADGQDRIVAALAMVAQAIQQNAGDTADMLADVLGTAASASMHRRQYGSRF